MDVLLCMGIFWTLYGIAGILGFQVVDEKYRSHAWSKKYIRCRGISWIMLGVPLLVLYLLTYSKDSDTLAVCLLILVCSVPSIVYSFAYERKYKRMLNGRQESESTD